MINLLPPEEKQKLLFEDRKKAAAILGITALAPLVCLILILLSVKLYLLGEIKYQEITLQQARQQYQTPDFLAFKSIIQDNNSLLSGLQSFYKKEAYLSETLHIIAGLSRPQNLRLTDISLSKNDQGKIKATMFGFSPTRDDLIAFQKNIEGQKTIENISFSPQSWVESQNVTFYLTFEILNYQMPK